MRSIFLTILLFPILVKSQITLPIKDGKIVYEQIDSISNVSRSELYKRSKIWVTKIFKSSKAVIQIDDSSSAQLIGKGNFDYYYQVLLSGNIWTCNFTLQIDCKENKSRIKIYDISSHAVGEATLEYFYKHHQEKHIKPINTEILALIANYKADISNQRDVDF